MPQLWQARSHGRAHRMAPEAFSAAQAFSAGNWADAALHGGPQDGVPHWAGKARAGLWEEALAALGECPGPEASYQRGVAAWLGHQEALALRLWRPLAEAGDARAAKLVAWLVSGARLPVAWMGSAGPGAAGDLATAMHQDERFSVSPPLGQPWFPQEPLPWHRPGALTPLWLGVHMLEWGWVPEALGDFPGLRFGFTSDFDLHLPQLYPFLHAFDALCVLDGTEWAELADLVEGPVLSMPLALGLGDMPYPSTPWAKRACEVFLSGTQIHPYHPDKAALAYAVLGAFGPKALGVAGWLGRPEYNALLGEAKATYTHYRRPGGTVTRGLEALALGVGVAVQEDSILRLYFGEAEGLLPYRHGDAESLKEALHRLLARPEAEAQAASDRATLAVRKAFGNPTVGAHMPRLLTVAAAESPRSQAALPEAQVVPRRLIFMRGWCLPPPLRREAFLRCQDVLGPLALGSASMANRFVRELNVHVLDGMGSANLAAFSGTPIEGILAQAQARQAPIQDFMTQSKPFLEALRLAHPRHLMLAFHHFALAWNVPSDPQRTEAFALGQAILMADLSEWELDPLDDPLPWDVWSHAFDHRGYVDAAMSLSQKRSDDLGPLVARILAAVMFHISEARQDLAGLECCVDWVPDFSPYALALAKALLAAGGPSRRAGVEILAQLLQGSSVWSSAGHLLARCALEPGALEGVVLPSEGVRAIQALVDQGPPESHW